MDKIALGIIADFLINLAAGWVGIAVVLPIGLRQLKKLKIDWKILTVDIVCASLSLLTVYFIRRNVYG